MATRPEVVARLRAAGCVYAEDEADLLLGAARSPAELDDLVTRRASGLPLEPLLGWAEFCGLRIAVEPGVFVPRRRTELVVAQAVALARPGAVVVDLCCGSGAIGTALAAQVEHLDLHATDIEPAAVRCARRNIEPAGGHVYSGDLFDPLPARLRGRVDLIVVNAPYVPTDAIATMPPEARLHEPRVTLDGGGDGLDVHRRVAARAADWLAPGGSLVIETSRSQAAGTVDLVERSGLTARVTTSDELQATVVIGIRAGGARRADQGADGGAGGR
ncbi:putative protein N(5)-glutamine methyltransferase [Pengzhenrongella frigida]|nr:putative protein N(5)-glutamine methyltransferase [Cellulomonas sp. HLT2-17]